jgi:HD superfamily phosphohydrolase
MPNYGLDPDQRGCIPWELPRSVLAPGKVITDPVHGDVFLTKLEVAVVDSRPFQRLRRIRQLGNTHLVYPGAVHTRFSHSLGALKVAQMLLDVVWNQSGELHGVEEDLFAEWRQGGARSAEAEWAKATVLARLGALLHDLCHVPAGHTVEDDLGVLEPHDRNQLRFEALWEQLQADVPERLQQLDVDVPSDREVVERALLDWDGPLHLQLRPLIISKAEETLKLEDMEYPFCADLVGNTICADLLDYLDRDHLFTGLPESLGRRFISAFFVTPSNRGPFSKRLALNIVRDGHERTDIVSELLKALRYRYELSERALVHHAKLSADAMLGESIERWEWALWWSTAKGQGLVDEIESRADFAITRVSEYRTELERAVDKKQMSRREWAQEALGQIEDEVRLAMEKEFGRLGDEALLDYLAGLRKRSRDQDVRPLLAASTELAELLRNRRLFAIAARIGASDVSPESVHDNFGDPAVRAELEASAQRFAGLDDGPRVVLWIPKPDMRLKLAEVLVQQETGIAPFVTYERSRSRRGSDIYDAHERLWATYVFVDREVSAERMKAIAAYLGSRMGIRWEQHRDIGGTPDEWPLRLAVAEVFEKDFESEVDQLLKRIKPELASVAARKQDFETFAALCNEVDGVRRALESQSQGE